MNANPEAFTGIAELGAWLDGQPKNTPGAPYAAALNVPGLDNEILESALRDKYVSLDLSGSTLTGIGEKAFYGCESLTALAIPAAAAVIDSRAFSTCYSLAAIEVDSANAAYCSEGGVLYDKAKTTLIRCPPRKPDTVFTVPDSVTRIEDAAFADWSGLAAIEVGPANAAYCSADGVLYDKAKTTLILYPPRKADAAFTVPDGVAVIGEAAFSVSCLTAVTIPASVTAIGDGNFTWCPDLAAIEVAPANAAFCSADGVLYDKAQTTLILYPPGKPDAAFAIPKGVTRVGKKAFYECFRLTAVTIPSSVTTMGERAFAHSGLTAVTIPASVISIGKDAFTLCGNLESVTFLGTIAQADFPPRAFPGEVREEFYKSAPENGTPGTYTNTVKPSTI